tara:strand:+ start:649 stop:3144 length:2496 start_codon:yes stop_codon:yes gene_type:complete
MAAYVRQSTFSDGDTIFASLLNNEFDQLLAAFNVSTGHTHDGSTTGDGGPISKLFSNAITFGKNENTDIAVTFDGSSNDGVITWMEDEDYFQYSDDILLSTTEKVLFRDSAIYINSSTDGQLDIVADTEVQIAATTVDINANADVSGTLTYGSLSDGAITITAFVDEDNMSSNSATLVPTQQSVKAYVDAQLTASDLDIQGDSGGAFDIDLDDETLTIAGGTGIDTSGTGTTLTVAIDSTVATLAGSQALTNKTLTSPVINTGVSGTAILDEDDFASDSATKLATQQSIKAYIATQVAASDTLAELSDTNISTPSSGQILIYDGSDSFDNKTVSGDVTISSTGATTIGSGAVETAMLNANVISGQTALTSGFDTANDHLLIHDADAGLKKISLANVTSATGGISDVVSDTTPQLGGDLDVNGNAIVSASNGNISITPNGSGKVILDGLSHPTSDGSAGQFLKTDGGGNLAFATVNTDLSGDSTPQLGGNLDVNGNSIVSVSNGNISITPNGSGKVILDGLSHPTSDGSNGQVLTTDGAGNLSFTSKTVDTTNLVDDTTPQLGGDLDINGNAIVSTSNGNIAITPNGSGKVILDGLSHPTADGSNGQFLKTDGGGTLSFASVTQATGNELENLSEDTSPQLGGNLDVNGNDIVSTSNANIDILPNGSGVVNLDGNGSSGGVSVSDGLIDIRTGTGNVAKVKFYCESSNAHAQTLQAAPHSAASSAVLVLPTASGTLVGTGDTGSVSNTMLGGSIADSKLSTISTANKVSLAAVDIDGATDIGADLTTSDLIAVDDGAGGTNRKAALSRVVTLVENNASFSSQGFATAMAIAL